MSTYENMCEVSNRRFENVFMEGKTLESNDFNTGQAACEGLVDPHKTEQPDGISISVLNKSTRNTWIDMVEENHGDINSENVSRKTHANMSLRTLESVGLIRYRDDLILITISWRYKLSYVAPQLGKVITLLGFEYMVREGI